MSPTSLLGRRRTPAVVLVALALVVVGIAWIARPDRAESVVPPVAKVGTLTYTTISTAVTPIRSFSFGATATACDPTSGGACAGKPEFAEPTVTLDTSILSPAELDALATGRHVMKLTVALYNPNTQNRLQEFVFDDVTFTSFATSRGGGNAAPATESLGWSYHRVTQRIYNPGTQDIVSENCYDLVDAKRC